MDLVLEKKTRGLGPCPVCKSTEWWFNDVPLHGFCWGSKQSPHKEIKKLVPPKYNPYMVRGRFG